MQNNTQNLDIVSLINNSSLTTLNNDENKSKLIKKVQASFSDTQQQLFIASFYCYLNHNPKTEFVIELKSVWKWCGFSRIDHAKVVLKKNFIETVAYKIIKAAPEVAGAGLSGAGLNKENVLMTINTFKKFCLKAGTKKADEIHDYYIKLEELVQETLNEENEELKAQLQIKEEEKENTLKLLEDTKKQLEKKTKLKVKKWYDEEPGHAIYAYKNSTLDATNQKLITIGKTINIKKRESGYLTHNQSGEMFYIKKCHNCDLTEKVIHHILDKYREESNKEWFHISEELVIYTIDMVCNFLDTFINCTEKLQEFKINEFIDKLPIEKFDTSVKLKEELHKPDLVYNKNIKDYNRFIRECCEFSDDMETLPYDILSAYRIWCKRILPKEIQQEFSEHLKTNFHKKEKYNPKTGIRSIFYTELKLLPLEFKPDNVYDKRLYERFCLEECVVNYSYKIKYADFIETYTEWIEKDYPDYTITSKELAEIKDYFNHKLLFDAGFIYGIQLKTDKLPTYRIRENSTIHMLNDEKEILNVYNGLEDASDKLNLKIKTISDIIRYYKVIDYKQEKIILVYNKEENVIKRKNMELKIIYKYNYDTKELLKKYNSVKEAIIDLEITSHTIYRYININKVFNTKKDDKVNVLISYLDNIANVKPLEKTKVIKTRPCKKLYTYDSITKELYKEYNGPSDAANKLNIGQCTVQRHIKSKNSLKLKLETDVKQIIFTYSKEFT